MLFVLQSKNSKFKGSTVFLVIYVCRHQDFVTFKLSGQEFLRKLADNFFPVSASVPRSAPSSACSKTC